MKGAEPIAVKYVAVWMDHKEARIFHILPNDKNEMTVEAPHLTHRKHPKGNDGDKDHPDDAKRFFHSVAASLEGNSEILLVGPSTAKLEFLRYVHKHDHAMEPRIVGIETVDHPTDKQLVAYANEYFDLAKRPAQQAHAGWSEGRKGCAALQFARLERPFSSITPRHCEPPPERRCGIALANARSCPPPPSTSLRGSTLPRPIGIR